MFVDTLPFPYYDLLVVNAFVEFEDLMYSVGNIEDGIRKEKIAGSRASTMEKKGLVSIDVFKQCLGKKRSKKRSHSTREEPVKNHSRSPWYA